MKELLVGNINVVVTTYSFIVFAVPFAIATFWHLKLMNGIRIEMGPKSWTTIFPNKEAREIIENSKTITGYRKKRNLWFGIVMLFWLVGIGVLFALIGWLNGKL